MKQYAVDDCLAVAELYFHMHPETINNDQQLHEVPQTTTTIHTTTAETTTIPIDFEDELSIISEDELLELIRPKFNKKQEIVHHTYHQDNKLTAPMEHEINELIQNQQPPLNTLTTSTSTLTKTERQRRKNQKLKWKQKHRPDFQRKIKRPIYYRYDYRKIRSQLADDDIHTSHQITISKNKQEVLIGFKSKEEEEKARKKIKINYFSREQYKQRWG
ncbi:unnamed protein product [Rotaria sp. Silwood2]|nr:unnamed protein product [Rotaria sp. Silwood2]